MTGVWWIWWDYKIPHNTLLAAEKRGGCQGFFLPSQNGGRKGYWKSKFRISELSKLKANKTTIWTVLMTYLVNKYISIKYLALLCLLWKVIKVIIDLVKLLSCSVSQHKFYIIIFIFCLGRGLTLECIHIITMCNNVEIRTSFMNSKRNVRNYVNAFIIDYGMDTKPLIGISIERSITEFQWWRGKYICSFPMHQLFTVLSVAQLLLYRNEISTHFSGYTLLDG